MSVRIDTPVISRTRPRTRTPSFRPGPRNEVPDVRFALSYDALKMNGTPARRVMSRSASAVSTACASLSMTHGPAMSVSEPSPTRTLPAVTIAGRSGRAVTRLPYHGRRGRMTLGRLVLVARVDESGKQRMRRERLRLELRMELHRDVPRMRRELH